MVPTQGQSTVQQQQPQRKSGGLGAFLHSVMHPGSSGSGSSSKHAFARASATSAGSSSGSSRSSSGSTRSSASSMSALSDHHEHEHEHEHEHDLKTIPEMEVTSPAPTATESNGADDAKRRETEELFAWVRRVVRALEATAKKNDSLAELDERAKVFLGEANFPVDAFVESILRGIHALTDSDTVSSLLVLTLCFLDRLPSSEAFVQSKTLRRLLYTGIFIAVKVLIDETLGVKDYCQVSKCKVDVVHMNNMEFSLAKLMAWRLHVSPVEFYDRMDRLRAF